MKLMKYDRFVSLLLKILITFTIAFTFPGCMSESDEEKKDDAMTQLLISWGYLESVQEDTFVGYLTSGQQTANILMNVALDSSFYALKEYNAKYDYITGQEEKVNVFDAVRVNKLVQDVILYKNQPDILQKKIREHLVREEPRNERGVTVVNGKSIEVTIPGIGIKTASFDYAEYLEEAGISNAPSCPLDVEYPDPEHEQGEASVKGNYSVTPDNSVPQETDLLYTGKQSMDLEISFTDYGVYYTDYYSMFKVYEDFDDLLTDASSGDACGIAQTTVSRINSIIAKKTITEGGLTVALERTLISEDLHSIDLLHTTLTLDITVNTTIKTIDGEELDGDLKVTFKTDIDGDPGTFGGTITIIFEGEVSGYDLNAENDTLQISF